MEENSSRCLIGRTLDALTDPHKSALQKILDTAANQGGLSAAQVAKLMKEAGLRSSETTVTRHRLGTCACLTIGTQWKTPTLIDSWQSALTVTP